MELNPRPGLGRLLRFLALCSGLLWPTMSLGETETQLKAAFTYNFTKYISWPEAHEQAGGELRICVYSSDKVADELKAIHGRTVRQYSLSVVKLASLNALADCNVIYTESAMAAGKIIRSTKGKPILSVSDRQNFVAEGGMIQLVKDGKRVRFDINLRRARESELQISSRLLQLAREVR